MAGDAIAERNRRARENIANDPTKSAAKLAQIDDKYKQAGYSDRELIMAFQGSKFDQTDYSRLTGGKKPGEKDPEAPKDPESPMPERPDPKPGDPGNPDNPENPDNPDNPGNPGGGSGNYNEGDGTRSTMQQFRRNGPTGIKGDFKGSGKDFVDYYASAGRSGDTDDWVERYRSQAQGRIDGLDVIDTAAMRTNRMRSLQDSKDRATLQSFINWGDYMHKDYKPPTWENSPPSEVETPDFEDLYDKARKGLK